MSLREPGSPDEVEQLRRALRDVVALTTLPSVWTGYDASQICHDVVDLVGRMARLDGVLLSARASAGVEVLELKDDADRELEGILRAAADRPLVGETRVPCSSGEVQLLAYPISARAEDRLVAAAYRAGFPGENARLLLRIAANQAAVAIDNARLYRNAQEANRAKDEFLANLSHELRTPMTAILGWVHLLQIGDLDEEEVRVGIDTIRSSADAQARLIDELLDVSRIVTGKLNLNPSVIDVSEIVRTAASAIAPAAAAKRHHLLVDIAPGPVAVLGDPARLQQVFWNLLSNAVKFTPPGGTIGVSVGGKTPAEVSVVVRDSGEGIVATFLPLVFERFRQAATPQRGRAGLGLGLAIARELVEMHGGSIEVASEGPGRGSTFTVTLPRHFAAAAAAPPEEQRPRHRLDSLRVLLVDDDEPTRTMLTTLLRRYGANVTAASSADEARAVVDACNPQILITDIAMPRTDGVALLQLLRRSGRPRFPAVAVTAHAEVQSRDAVLSAGFEGFLAKPLDPDTLIAEIERALANHAGR